MIDRRAFLGSIGLIAAAGGVEASRAQQPERLPKIGVLVAGPSSSPYVQALEDGLRDLGYAAGKTAVIEVRAADLKPQRLPDLAADLVQRQRVDVIVAMVCGKPTIEAIRQASRTVPLVVAICGDLPGFNGEVASFARPGGQTTGLTFFGPELSAKRLGLLREILPELNRVAVLWNPEEEGWTPYWRELEKAAAAGRMRLQSIEVRGRSAIDGALREVAEAQAKAVVVLGAPVLFWERARIAEIALQGRRLAVGDVREYAVDGALMSYGPDFADMARRAATYVDKILKGARPGDLPVEQPTKFQLVINLKTATALGLTIPQSLLLRADQVIE